MAGPLVYPEAANAGESVGGIHDTLGLAGFPARDFFAPAGTVVVAPEAGTIVKLSGSDPSVKPSDPHGAYGLSEYLKGISGTIYFITHLGSETVKQNQIVVQGQPLGTVADFSSATGGATPNHVHIGTFGPDTATMLMNAPKLAYSDVVERGSKSAAFDSGLVGAFLPGGADAGVAGAAAAGRGAVEGLPGIKQLLSVGDLIGWLSKGKNITRVAEVLAGAALTAIGVVALAKAVSSPRVSPATNVVRSTASVARRGKL